MFNKIWFVKHQKLLLWLLNTPLIRIWFRWILCINGKRSFVGKRDIFKIEPHAITWIEKIKPCGYHFVKGKKRYKFKIYFSTEFRTHNKFSKRIFYAFYPLWWLMHQWDTLFANNFRAAWNLGFDTLTVYPDPDPETSSTDGMVRRSGVDEVFGTIRGGAGTSAFPTLTSDSPCSLYSTGTSGQYSELRRGIFVFDTSSIPDGNSVDAATLSLWVISVPSDAFSESVGVVASTPATNTDVVAADYSQLGTTRFATDKTLASLVTSAYNDFALNASGLAAVSKTGVSKFGTRLDDDIDNTAPTWQANVNSQMNIKWADDTGTANDPKLVVIHTLTITYTKEFNETITISDTLLKAIGKTFSETITLSEIFSTLHAHFKTFTETAITISDTFQKAISKTFSETITLSEIFTKILTRIFSDTFTLSDTFTKVRLKTFNDAIRVVDSMWKRFFRGITGWTKDTKTPSGWNKDTKTPSGWKETETDY